MIYAEWEDERTNITEHGLYNGELAWASLSEDTWSPCCTPIFIIEFKVKGKTYTERKECVREIAKKFQSCLSCDLAYSEWHEIGNWFEENGKRYGLLTEFRENCIC